METILWTLILLISTAGVLCQYGSNQIIVDSNPVSASYDLYQTVIERECIAQNSQASRGRLWPVGQSIENFIALVELLETLIHNGTDANLGQHRGADNVAKLLLRRFRFEGYDPSAHPLYKKPREINSEVFNSAILKPVTGSSELPQGYYFPDQYFSIEEKCSMHQMLSHNIYNINKVRRTAYSQVFRGKRQAISNRQNQNQYQNQYQTPNQRQTNWQNAAQNGNNNYNNNNNNNNRLPIASNYVNNYGVNRTLYPIREEGVVSLRANQLEAIAVARVLLGVIAGLTPQAKTQTRDILKAVGYTDTIKGEYDKQLDPVAAVTLADLWSVKNDYQNNANNLDQSTIQFSDLYGYGADGKWSSTSCTSHYGLDKIPMSQLDQIDTLLPYIIATKAEIRGGIDGYLIGKNLRNTYNMIDDPSRLRLATILRAYYSKPQTPKSTTFTASYCDRQKVTTQELQNIRESAQTYQGILSLRFGLSKSPDLSDKFQSELNNAITAPGTSGTDFCNTPGGILDKTAPCETPSDVIYIIDGSTPQKLQQSADIVAATNAMLNNIRSDGGVISIFLNSNSSNDINNPPNMPLGIWPLVPVSFNSSNTGCSQCRIDDFNTTSKGAANNAGVLFRALNTTLFNYEWWNPRTNQSAIPAKSAVLIDFSSIGNSGSSVIPESGVDRDDYNYFKDQLRYRHRDVRFISVSSQPELFKDILREDTDREIPGNNAQQIGQNLAQKICENPATFQYNACHDRKSDGIQYVGYITPGYKQNWAMYPEFFLRSFNIKFTFKPEDGDIKVCYDRSFPPEWQDYCKELKNGEEQTFEISDPCKGKSFSSCKPFYFSVWGKERTSQSQCLEKECMNLDQIKFTVKHSGVQCSSSLHIQPSVSFQFISVTIFFIIYLFLNK